MKVSCLIKPRAALAQVVLFLPSLLGLVAAEPPAAPKAACDPCEQLYASCREIGWYDPYSEGAKYYFGLGVERDYKKAFACLSKSTDTRYEWLDYSLLILMCLNGDGVAKNPVKALEIWNKHTEVKADGTKVFHLFSGLEEPIRARLKKPKATFTRVEMEHVVVATPEIGQCYGIKLMLKNQEVERFTAYLKCHLPALGNRELAKMGEALYRLGETESDAVSYSTGTWREMYSAEHDLFLYDMHLRRLRGLSAGVIPVTKTSQDLARAERQLDAAYRKALDDFPKEKELEEERELYRNCLEEGCKAWSEYRDAWVRLMVVLKGEWEVKVVEESVKTWLAEERVTEYEKLINPECF